MQVREDDLREDGSSSGVNPESEISNMPDGTRHTQLSKPSFIKSGLVGEGWWKGNLEIIELRNIEGNGFNKGCRFEKLRVEQFLTLYLNEFRHNKMHVLLHDLKITSRHKDFRVLIY
jgi:hypothetical protein